MVCYETDASRLTGICEKILFPETKEEVQKIVKQSKADIVPRGAGTQLVGGVIPNNSILIDMCKMNKVTNFMPSRRTVRVEAGITLKELNEKIYNLGLEFPVDPLKKQVSTIGGMIAINSMGERSMRYGNIRDWIEEIEFVNGKGELAKTSKADLTDVCGMEGTSGIIVAATIKLSPIIKRTASAFQTEKLDEILSLVRKLKTEKEVVLLELFSPFVSRLLGLPEKYNLIIEFNSDRGKIRGKDYEELTKIRESVFSKLLSEGYYNLEDPRFFFDKLKEFIIFLEDNKIPYIGHLGSGIIHPFFKDNAQAIREKVIEIIKKTKASNGCLGIGLKRKYLIDGFQAKLIERVKLRHDPYLKFNKNKLIEVDKSSKKFNLESGILKEKHKPAENQNTVKEQSPEQKMKDFIKRVEIEEKEVIAKREKNKENFSEDIKDLNSAEDSIMEKLKDYEETYKSELPNANKIEKIAREIVKEKEQVDYRSIQDIMTGKKGFGREINTEEIKTQNNRVTMTDNLKKELSPEDRDLIKKIIGNTYKKENDGKELK